MNGFKNLNIQVNLYIYDNKSLPFHLMNIFSLFAVIQFLLLYTAGAAPLIGKIVLV